MAYTESTEAIIRSVRLVAGTRVVVTSPSSHHRGREGVITRFLVSHDGKVTWAEIKPDCCQAFLEEVQCVKPSG